jgi:hypothetical protein
MREQCILSSSSSSSSMKNCMFTWNVMYLCLVPACHNDISLNMCAWLCIAGVLLGAGSFGRVYK